MMLRDMDMTSLSTWSGNDYVKPTPPLFLSTSARLCADAFFSSQPEEGKVRLRQVEKKVKERQEKEEDKLFDL